MHANVIVRELPARDQIAVKSGYEIWRDGWEQKQI